MTLDDLFADLPSDSMTLVTGPPMTGKYELLFHLVSRTGDDHLFITTKYDAAQLVEDYRATVGASPGGRIGVIDSVPMRRKPSPSLNGQVTVESVDSPGDLTSIGVKFTELLESFEDHPDPVGIGLHSVSQLVMQSDLETVYQFLQVLTGQLRTAGWPAVSVVDRVVVDGADTAVLEHHFDVVVETRSADGRRECRVRSPTRTSDWQPF